MLNGVCGAGNGAEAIRGLQTLQQRRETEYPSMCALLYFHRLASMVDRYVPLRNLRMHFLSVHIYAETIAATNRQSVETLEASLPTALTAATDSSTLLAANFRLIIGDYTEAARLSDRLMAPNNQPQTPLQHQAHVS